MFSKYLSTFCTVILKQQKEHCNLKTDRISYFKNIMVSGQTEKITYGIIRKEIREGIIWIQLW